MLINNTDKPLPWRFDLTNADPDLEEGVFKFLRPDGSPYVTLEGEEAIMGTLQPEQKVGVGVCFSPREFRPDWLE